MLLHVNLGVILGGTGRCNMIGEKEKGNKNMYVRPEVNYTFLDTGLIDIERESEEMLIRPTQV